jgi:hypothetical protein
MLSVNIPVFNIDVTALVHHLVLQAEKLHADFEIRVYDDGSNQNVKIMNREIQHLRGVVYHELSENLGRADSMPVTENYLKQYVENLQKNVVVCGGTAYQNKKPSAPGEHLRWYYGTHRESISAAQRNRTKGFIITSNNFLIEKQVFERIKFCENIGVYGHEDTLLGYDLFKKGICIQHIDNQVFHTGLEDAPVFIKKTQIALESLHKINNEILPGDAAFCRQVNFLNRYISITRFLPASVLRLFFKMFHRIIEVNLKSTFPFLFLFDLYKLSYYAILEKK